MRVQYPKLCNMAHITPLGTFSRLPKDQAFIIYFRLSLSVSSGHIESAFPPVTLFRKQSLEVAHQTFLQHGKSIVALLALRLYAYFASLLYAGPLSNLCLPLEF